jgi:hypothetical protein
MFAAVCLGFALLPETHTLFRAPAAIALAVLVGAGAQLIGGQPGRGDWLGTRWVVPAGGILAGVGWLSSIGERSWLIPPMGAAVILGLVALQVV